MQAKISLMNINLSVFKSYDVRGVYPTEINETVAAHVAMAFASYLGAAKIVIGRDARESSPALYEAVIRELVSMGVDVYDIGVCCTPLLNYAVVSKGFRGGIMISASHNPREYNALKLIRDGVQISSPGGLDEVRRIVERHAQVSPIRPQKGQVYSFHVIDEYLAELMEDFASVRNLKVVVDYGNGMGSVTAKPFFDRVGMKVIELNQVIDCTFPNHPANPAEEKNLEQLKKAVLDLKADCGIAFDGDADRSFLVDDTGRIIYPDIYSAIIAKSQLVGKVEKRVYFDLRFSRVTGEEVRAHGGEPVLMRVGNPFYKEKLKDEGGVFAAELSGHVMFADHYDIDDGLYAALKCLKVIVDEKKKLSELAGKFMVYAASPELNFHVNDADATLDRVRREFRDGHHIELDGVYVEYPDWWFNLRKSNTEPIVRLRVEAKTKEKMQAMKDKLVSIINS